jgi:hypothetical protein
MVMAYGAWMLYGNVSQLEHVLGANLDRHERSHPTSSVGSTFSIN